MSPKAKGVLTASVVFLLYLLLLVGLARRIHLQGSRFGLFTGILAVLGLLACVLSLIYWWRSQPRAPSDVAGADATNLVALLRAANAKLKSSPGGAKSLASLPLVYVLGDENAAKTQTVLQAGLDPELLAGAVYRDGLVAPTQLANVWFTQSAAIVEAGGALLKQPALWQRLVRLTQPGKLRTAFKKGALQPTRAAVLCVSVERLQAAAAAPDAMRALGQAMNERLRQLSQTLGISLPVYVLFTKLDMVPSFADFAANLNEEEARLTVGALLARPDAGAGLYAERATADTAARFDELCYSLGEFRLELLARGGPPEKLAKAYEFPRELRKLRQAIVDLLVETGRPSQLGVNPFLRGFYFTGMRARVVGETQPGILTPAAALPGMRRVPQWVFLPHLFPRIILADRTALDTSRASTKVNVVKRVLIGTAAAALLVYLVGLTASYVNNAALEERLAQTAALPMFAAHADTAAASDFANLEQLRQVFAQITDYRRDGAPLSYRWGLFNGDRLYNAACTAYGNRFRTVLLTPTEANILARLVALPAKPQPTDEYTLTYNPLRAYLITTSNPEKSTTEFLPGALEGAWTGTHTVSGAVANLTTLQFQTYAATLAEPNSCMATLGGPARGPAVEQARGYLGQFQGFEQVYLSMKAAADRRFALIRFNEQFPGTVKYVVDGYTVEGAFTRGGWDFMQNAIAHPEPYTSGEEWVLGPRSGNAVDRATLNTQLPQRYQTDFLNTWRTYLKTAHVVTAGGFPEAKEHLHQLDSPSSALLELFQLISQNTAVPNPAFSQPFQAPQAVVPPTAKALPVNTGYTQGLQGLEGAINSMLMIPNSQNDPTAVSPVINAASQAEAAVGTVRGGFSPPDPVGGMDTTSEKLLLAPIKTVEELAKAAPAKAAGGGAKTFCAGIAPVLSEFPFNPDSHVDATPDEVARVFQPSQGALAQYAASLSKIVTLQGSYYAQTPGSMVTVNPAFLHFLNAAQQISNAFFPVGGGQPQVSFTLTQETTPNLPPATLQIDGTTLSAAGQTKQFLWTSTPGSNIKLNAAGYTNPASGPWALFHFAYGARHPAPNRLEFVFQMNGQTAASATGVPLDYKYDVGGPGAALLNPGFMRSGLRCVAKVAQ